MRRKAAVRAGVASVAILIGLGACDPCFGTGQCVGSSQLSMSGRVIEHATNRVVPGTRVALYWRPGVALEDDSAVAVTGEDGAFRLSHAIPSGGTVRGRLSVTPPPPHTPYTVPNFEVPTRSKRGDGVWIGDVVVDPYYLLVGEVHDRYTGGIVSYADVQFSRVGGVEATPATFGFTAEESGRVYQEIRTKGYGTLDLEVTLTDYRYPRPYKYRLHITPQYLETPARELTILVMRSGLPYWLSVRRRGSPFSYEGVTLEYKYQGGVTLTAGNAFGVEVPSSGVVVPFMKATEEGVVYANFKVYAPGFRDEVFPVEMATRDGDSITVLNFAFGSQVYAKARFRYRATGNFLEEGVNASVKRRSGMGLDFDDILVPLDSTGTLRYSSSTSDTGTTVADIHVKMREPFDYDTIRSIVLKARLDSFPNDLGTLLVGRWLPWSGSVVDATNSAPIAGAVVEFTRTGGIPVAPSPYRTISSAAGTFGIRPVPLRGGAVQGNLSIKFGGGFRDTIITGLQLTTSKDDTVRTIPVIRAQRIP